MNTKSFEMLIDFVMKKIQYILNASPNISNLSKAILDRNTYTHTHRQIII